MPAISYESAHGAPAGYYPVPEVKAAGPVSALTPELEAQLANYRHDHVPDGPCRHPMPNGAETWEGKCAKHKGTPAQRAEQRRWERKAAAVTLAQQLAAGMLGDPVRVVDVDQALQEDSYGPRPPIVDRVTIVP